MATMPTSGRRASFREQTLAGRCRVRAIARARAAAARFRASGMSQGTAHYIDDIREPDGTLHVGDRPVARSRAGVSRPSIWPRCAPARASSRC